MSPREQALLDFLAATCGATWEEAIEAAADMQQALAVSRAAAAPV
jgi:hypothetical protein